MSQSIQRTGTTSRFSSIVIHERTVYLAGQVSQLQEADIREQSQDVFAKVDQLLKQAGSDRSLLLSAQIWLRTMDDYDGMNAVWDQWLEGIPGPVRVCVEARMAKPHYRIEVQVTAALD